MVLYGPPGSGKTTLARLIAVNASAAFEELSAVNAGRQEVRDVIERAEHRRATSGEPTILFLDEIHRFNKAQQDTLLPAVEEGLRDARGRHHREPLLRGELGAALALPRLRAARRSARSDVLALLRRALGDERGVPDPPEVDDDALEFLAARSGGDARTALAALELACETAGGREVTSRRAEDALQRRAVLYDKGGDRHYDTISAWIKATRGSDPDASLLYLAEMLEGGEDPRFIARRMVILASEDIGNADPRALQVAVAAAHAVEHVGLPECAHNLAQAACTSRWRRSPTPPTRRSAAPARGCATTARPTAALPAPLLGRRAPDGRGLRLPARPSGGRVGAGADAPEAEGERFLELSEHGEEPEMRERLERIRRLRAAKLREADRDPASARRAIAYRLRVGRPLASGEGD